MRVSRSFRRDGSASAFVVGSLLVRTPLVLGWVVVGVATKLTLDVDCDGVATKRGIRVGLRIGEKSSFFSAFH